RPRRAPPLRRCAARATAPRRLVRRDGTRSAAGGASARGAVLLPGATPSPQPAARLLPPAPPAARRAMRILLVTSMPPSPRGRGAVPLARHAQLLGRSARHDVRLVTAGGPEPAELEALAGLERYGVEVHAVRRGESRGLARWERRRRLAADWARGVPWRTAWF